ncbi:MULTISPECIES: hypothetical protein [unclassified Mesorhizobium]|uniref:hypothetical protein n=1 Tax=unclassified Mesorhizobium TaxID=325217 RepID=UPI000BB01D88|nr:MULTISPECIES: hypothetical protein [unclassified Mesorhizobium]PBC20013.1 hypothetical protein CK226_26760 [Mesorhizobium sp. WSM4311]TRC99195.1 hypothetical protein FJV82_23500 [Mesorhizobium sp. WSM4305]
MRICFLVTAVGFLFCATAANAADKTVHDRENGFALTFPPEWINEPPSGEAMRLSVQSPDRTLTCMVSTSLYDASAPDSPSDPSKFIEGWSMETWKMMMGKSFSTADFSNDKLARFPDGYPVRLADLDFTVVDNGVRVHGHSRFAFSLRGARYGYVNCSVMSESAEQVEQMWAPLADKAEHVVNSFVLDPP